MRRRAGPSCFEALYAQLLLSGNAYVEAVRDAQDLPVELHVLRADRMSVVPGADGWPVAYEYAVAGRKHRFDAGGAVSPVCHVKNFHPQDDHYGFSPMQAAAMALDVHNSASRWSKALLDNAARPVWGDCLQWGRGAGHHEQRPIRAAGQRDGKPPPRRAQCRAAHVARRRA